MAGIEFLKGHGTQNDFVLLPDPDAALELTGKRVAALCDRQQGIGADGVLRVVRSSAMGADSKGEWFMDYRNADGSIAEMCGNGVRVFARYLVEAGLEAGPEFVIGTRAGDRPVRVQADASGELSVTVHMGPVTVTGTSVAVVGGRQVSGVAVDVGNPHLVSVIDDDVSTLDLSRAPRYDTELFPEGVNLEFVNLLGPDALRMRVHERGVGETRACGTGTVAAVAAALHLRGDDTGESTVDIPGGRVVVTVGKGTSTLTGPAAFVARGELDAAWWDSLGER
ncbi:diaminopimelate epimerase [Saccharomonospora xinjiangensis]|uniref:Diaminopimelate epimerase n=1 Tax=Saccharomonospora xinjiangensis XJ-54 TaxID=882086 RepID=I0V692_9PSEU|nr:diaminopimelate epimerase [Saccharomonospora xinjiangensis]EID55645.1 diaminopimelate epimerase [Saccharomonospora xinjiangensis XJ-54]